MAKSEQKRQNKLAKKQARDRRKRQEASRKQQLLASLAGKMTAASHGRIVRCGVTEAVTTAGLGYVLIARHGPLGQLAIVVLLVDTYCLGVKDVTTFFKDPSEAEEFFKYLVDEQNLAPVSPGLARGLVEGAIAYARSSGFEPHADYRKVAPIWGDVEPESIEGHYEFGHEGKPLYVRGPYDDFSRQQFIVNTLEKTVGSGNYGVRLLEGGKPSLRMEDYEDDDEVDDSEDD